MTTEVLVLYDRRGRLVGPELHSPPAGQDDEGR